MYEYAIHLPKVDNDDNCLLEINREMIADLLSEFGGATVTDAQGMWVHEGKLYDEPVQRVVLAGEKCAQKIASIRYLAKVYARKTGQLAMYIITPFGVEIIDTAPATVAA